MPAKRARSLKSVVGQETYSVWVDMLRRLVPDGRTHRLAPLVAGMLQYALSVTEKQGDDEADEDSVAQSLINSAEAGDPDEVKELLHDVVSRLFKDAGVSFQRTNSRGEGYSIADSAYEEYISWFNMPWET
jgi:hypothetical protein